MSHPNDTLGGKLLAFEREDEKHLRRKLGYWRMVEDRMVRDQLAAEGVTPDQWGFWSEISRRMVENHKDDASFKVPGYITQQISCGQDEQIAHAKDACVEALRQIRDGHNDPRLLAREALERLEGV